MRNESYSLRIVTKWLDTKNIKYKCCSGGGLCFYQTGCQIHLNNGFKLSIQTDPSIAGESFAETALLLDKRAGVVYGPCGYGDVKRHDAPDDLFKEIEWMLTQNITEADIDNEREW